MVRAPTTDVGHNMMHLNKQGFNPEKNLSAGVRDILSRKELNRRHKE